MQDKVQAVDLIKTLPGLYQRVGTSGLSRGSPTLLGKVGQAVSVVGMPELIASTLNNVSGDGQNFAGAVHKLVGGLTLDNLIAAKARGATFGALSEGELNILASSATALNDWEIKDSSGKGTGYWNIDEASFKKELDTIKQLTQRAIYQSQGSVFSPDEQAVFDQIDQTSQQTINPADYFNK